LDEAQMIPLEYMKPCLWALAELVLNYGATVVLCTATQPAIKELVPGNLEPVEIMEDPAALQKTFKRVTVHYGGKMTDNEVIAGMMENSQVLTIVNTRRHARILFDLLLEQTTEGVYHLSARMCPAHRKEVLAEIKKALLEGKPCRVVSTQLIEAGVDVDFPAVYRSAAGIDSIAQAAGRCNREGRRKDGFVIVFEPEAHGMPTIGRFELVAGLTRMVVRQMDQSENDLMSLAAIEGFFKQLLSMESDQLDAHKILSLIKGGEEELSFPFVEIANKFQLIDSATVSVVGPWGDHVLDVMEEIEHHPFPASRIRGLQPYIVQVYQYELEAFQKAKVVKSVGDVIKFVTDSSFYDSRYGLKDAKEVKASTGVMIF